MNYVNNVFGLINGIPVGLKSELVSRSGGYKLQDFEKYTYDIFGYEMYVNQNPEYYICIENINSEFSPMVVRHCDEDDFCCINNASSGQNKIKITFGYKFVKYSQHTSDLKKVEEEILTYARLGYTPQKKTQRKRLKMK